MHTLVWPVSEKKTEFYYYLEKHEECECWIKRSKVKWVCVEGVLKTVENQWIATEEEKKNVVHLLKWTVVYMYDLWMVIQIDHGPWEYITLHYSIIVKWIKTNLCLLDLIEFCNSSHSDVLWLLTNRSFSKSFFFSF